MLPLYQRVGMSPLSLACTTALAAGTMTILPWGGPTSRAATALQVGINDLFLPILPPMLVGVAAVFACAAHIGRRERSRLAVAASLDAQDDGEESALASEPDSDTPPPRMGTRWAVNAALTTAALVALFADVFPPVIVFLIGSALALIVNYPDAHQQRERLRITSVERFPTRS